jgi:hypothetical protein
MNKKFDKGALPMPYTTIEINRKKLSAIRSQ